MAIQTKTAVSPCPFKKINSECELDTGSFVCHVNGSWRSCETFLLELTKLDEDARAKKHQDECIRAAEKLEDYWKHLSCGATDWRG